MACSPFICEHFSDSSANNYLLACLVQPAISFQTALYSSFFSSYAHRLMTLLQSVQQNTTPHDIEAPPRRRLINDPVLLGPPVTRITIWDPDVATAWPSRPKFLYFSLDTLSLYSFHSTLPLPLSLHTLFHRSFSIQYHTHLAHFIRSC